MKPTDYVHYQLSDHFYRVNECLLIIGWHLELTISCRYVLHYYPRENRSVSNATKNRKLKNIKRIPFFNSEPYVLVNLQTIANDYHQTATAHRNGRRAVDGTNFLRTLNELFGKQLTFWRVSVEFAFGTIRNGNLIKNHRSGSETAAAAGAQEFFSSRDRN